MARRQDEYVGVRLHAKVKRGIQDYAAWRSQQLRRKCSTSEAIRELLIAGIEAKITEVRQNAATGSQKAT